MIQSNVNGIKGYDRTFIENMNIEDIQDSVRIGIEVTVILRTGHQFSGVLTEIRETSIILRQASGTKMPLSAEAIDCIFPIQSTDLSIEITPILQSAGTTASLPTRLSTSSNLQNNLEQKNSLLPLKTNESQLESPTNNNIPRYAIEVITKIVEIETRFSTAIAQVKLEPLPPDFSTPIEINSSPYLGSGEKKSMLGVWNKVKEQYDNAIKNKDSQLLNRPIESCEQLIKKYPKLGCSRFNLGCLYYQQGQNHKAVEVFELAVSKSKDPRVFYNLAIIVLKSEPAKSCYALHEYFKISSPSENIVAWYKFIDLSLNSGVINQLSNLFEQAIENNRENDGRLIIESAVFALKKHNQNKEAEKLTDSLIQYNLELGRLSQILKSMLSNLGLEATEAYLKQEQELKQAQEKAKRQENQIKQQKEVESLIIYAQNLGKRKQYAQAIAEIRKALEKDPENALAQNLLTEYREADKERGLPTGSGDYAQAKRAEIIEKDLKKAEKFYRQAINKNDNAENAVKDLAALLTRQNRDEEAIKILNDYKPKSLNKKSIDNMLANTYQHAKMYREALKLLNDILKSTPQYESKKIANILTQISVCQVKDEKFDEAEKTLSRLLAMTPTNNIAKKWLEALQQAKQTGFYASLEQIFIVQDTLNDSGTNISKFLEFYLDRCEYQGVNEAQISTRNFSEEDVRKLRGLIEGAGRKRPGLRAQYNLSSAKLLIDLDSEGEQQKIRLDLQDYALAMGDSCLLEQKHQDIILSYYLEAFSISPKWHKKLNEQLSRSLTLLYKPISEISIEKVSNPEDCLNEAIKKGRGTQAIDWLLSLSLNTQVAEFLLTLIDRDKNLSKNVQLLCYEILGESSESNLDFQKFTDLWGRTRDLLNRRNEEIIRDLSFLESSANNLGSLQDQITQIQSITNTKKIRASLDKRRLNEVSRVLGLIFDYSQQKAYTERERLITLIKKQINQISDEIEKEPTKYSLELFYPYLKTLEKTIEEHFKEIQIVAEPNELQTNLSIDSYTPDENSTIKCQITITNENGKSPASSIKIHVKPSLNNEYIAQIKDIDVTEALAGGQSVTCQIPVTVTETAKESQVFTLYYGLSFITRRDEKKTIEDTQSIKLYSNTEFKEIKNPYATYAQGSTVENKDMFYGRDQLINVLLSSIRNASSVKSLVIYGQKRAGKSSVLYHLKQQLELPIIPVYFSIGDIIDDFSVGTFLYRIIQCIEDTFEDLNDEGYPAIQVNRPTLDELQQNSQLQFQDYMTNLRRSLKKVEEYKEAKIMLLIDEFSYIYGEIMRGRIQDTFMKSWKALLEKRHFGAVLVGQDTMPQFIAHFPNEFQVAESQRISYLADDDARCLIINPILIPDTKESRYKGDAVNLLLRLTAGSPYYIQIFCNRLVEYMNRKKAIYVTDADIETIKEDLISGHNSLDDSVFDNLISAGDSSIDDIGKEDALAVLRDIANGARIQSHCDRSAINCHTSQPIDKILDNFVGREVIEKQGTSLYRIKVGLFKEWLLAHQ
ncbi:putative Cold-shock protein, DNA-binding [Planktothrix agardhii]|nr:putative Cold-shock protein, DNA-binding [Planktothrix agardhii]